MSLPQTRKSKYPVVCTSLGCFELLFSAAEQGVRSELLSFILFSSCITSFCPEAQEETWNVRNKVRFREREEEKAQTSRVE